MDATRFDHMIQRLGAHASRRQAVFTLAMGLFASTAAVGAQGKDQNT